MENFSYPKGSHTASAFSDYKWGTPLNRYGRSTLPKCYYCKCQYGTAEWNDDENLIKGDTPVNFPIKALMKGKTIYMCPTCYTKHHPIKYKEK